MKTRIYTRDLKGSVVKYDVDARITHKEAVESLKEAGVKHNGAILLIYSKL